MKFRIIRDYEDFQPQVLCNPLSDNSYWANIGNYRCGTIDEARQVCNNYKLMKTDPVIEEFEL